MATGWRAWGWDVRRGPRVTSCEAVELERRLVVPTFRDGEGKQVARVTMEHIRGAVVSAGLASDPEVDNVVGELGRLADDDRTLMSIAPTFQVWGRKAGA
jgi:hypothetical protein